MASTFPRPEGVRAEKSIGAGGWRYDGKLCQILERVWAVNAGERLVQSSAVAA